MDKICFLERRGSIAVIKKKILLYPFFSAFILKTILFIRVNNVLFETLTTFCKFMRKANLSQKKEFISS